MQVGTKIEIRQAKSADIDLLVRWRMEVLREVFGIFADARANELERANREYYRQALDSGGHIACFANINGEIVGCGGVCIYDEMPSPDNESGRCAYLMNIYTRKRFRGMGVGTAIVKWLVGRARALGISKIYLETTEDAEGLYRKAGFLEMAGYMKLGIS